MKRVFTTTVRLNLDDAEERQAFEYLQRLDRRRYRSYSRAIATAVNAYFGRQEQLATDPYLETREKEDAFLEEIEETIRSALSTGNLVQIVPGVQPTVTPAVQPDEADLSVALDFAEGF